MTEAITKGQRKLPGNSAAKPMAGNCWSLLLILLTVTAWIAWPTHDSDAQENSKGLKLRVVHSNGSADPRFITVSLYLDGKVMRNDEMQSPSQFGAAGAILWEKLSPGQYEIHFEANGFKKGIKRITLVDGQTQTPSVASELSKDKELILGGGPSLAEIQMELAALKKANVELQKKVESLEAEIAKLKRK